MYGVRKPKHNDELDEENMDHRTSEKLNKSLVTFWI